MPYTSDSWTFGHVPTTFKRLPTVNRWGVLHGFYSDQRDDQELSNSAPDMPSGVGFRILANRNIWRFPNIYGGSNVVGYASPNVDVLGTGAFSAMTRWVSSLQISTDGTNASSIQFDAGNSNHLYGLSGTVQPAGIYGLLLLKAY